MKRLMAVGWIFLVGLAGPASGAGHFMGWACGGSDAQGGILFATTNGADWTRQGVGQLPLVDLGGVCSSGTGNVWVVGAVEGAYASVYYSPDNGASWSRQGDASTLPSNDLQKVCVVQTQVVWAVGVGGSVVRTVNGGGTWEDVSVPGWTEAFQGVAAVDMQTAWVSGESNASGYCGLFATTNGGASWVRQTNGAVTNVSHLLGLAAVDTDHVWGIGGPEIIIYTEDGGDLWQENYQAGFKDGNEIYVQGSNRVFAAFDSFLLWSDDSGASWSNHTTTDYTMDISAPDGTNIWAIRNSFDGCEIYHSADAGASWGVQYTNTAGILTTTLSMEWREDPPPAVLYVDAASTHPVSPYDSWTTAAATIQDAVDAAAAGDRVWVTNGVYDAGGATRGGLALTNRVYVPFALTLQSVNGPEVTLIRGRGPNGTNAIRCVYLTNGATMSGFTLTNGHTRMVGLDDANRKGGGAYLDHGGTLTNCILTGNESGGAFCKNGGRIDDSLIMGNQADSGGGVTCLAGGEIHRSVIRENVAPGNGGGVDLGQGGVMRNCLIVGNSSVGKYTGFGGGVSVMDGEIVNCTIVGNEGTSGGGVIVSAGSTLLNSIVYGNTAVEDDNIRLMSGTVSYTCTDPDPGGPGNLVSHPLLAGVYNPHLLPASPCREVGSTNSVAAGETDIDGEPRIYDGKVDMGCDEFIATQIMGALTVAVQTAVTRVLVDTPLLFRADIQGKIDGFQWQISTNGGTWRATNEVEATVSWSAPGSYPVILSASNLDHTASATVTVEVLTGFTNYVSTTGGHVTPFTSWADAATNLQAAIDVCYAGGGVVMVQTGTYEVADAVLVDTSIIVCGAGARTETVVAGAGSTRVFLIDHEDAMVAGLRITDGEADEGGGAKVLAGTLQDCVISGNHAISSGGGVELCGTAVLKECEISENRADKWGGGISANDQSLVENCVISGNESLNYGGGVHLLDSSEIRNSFVTGNRSWGGGGAALRGTARNCTFTRNTAFGMGGGLYLSVSSAKAVNCILVDNEAATGENYEFDETAVGASITTSCTTPDPGGAGNITDSPLLLGVCNPHLSEVSPCIDAGSTNGVAVDETDIDGEARIEGGLVDIGCDEFIVTNLFGALTVDIIGDTNVVLGAGDPFLSDIAGKAFGSVWHVATNGGTFWVFNALEVDPAWSTPGLYPVVLSASNLDQAASATVSVHVVASFTNYVSLDGAHIAPFTNWASAATQVQAAVDACYAGGVVMVSTGTFRNGSEIRITKGITVSGVGNRDDTIIDGENQYRCLYLDDEDARLNALTITQGSDTVCGGVYMLAGTISNCVIRGNTGSNMCGGVQCLGNSVLRDSEISENSTWNWPGGVLCTHNGLVLNCHIFDNHANNRGGGVYCNQGGVVRGCRIEANSAMMGGGIHCRGGGWVEDCVIHSNSAANGAGIYFYESGTVTHSTIDWNWATLDGGGVWFEKGGTVRDCLVNHNFADATGGNGAGLLFFSGGEAEGCDIFSNRCHRAGGAFLQRGGLLLRSVLQENHAFSAGGGAFLLEGGEMRNCLLTGNRANEVGAGITTETGGDVIHCTLSDNTASNEAGGIYFYNGGACENTIAVSNHAPTNGNVVFDGGGTMVYSCMDPLASGAGNLASDPQFADAGASDFHLLPGSPCIDTGTNQVAVTNDLDGVWRPLDGDDSGSAIEDMGCYEVLNRAADSDGDIMPDGFEADYGLNPTDPADALGNLDGDPSDNRDEYIADTDPTNPASFFHLGQVSNRPPLRVYFLSSSNRQYTLNGNTNLISGAWTNVPGQGPRMGRGGLDWMEQTNTLRMGHYRISVRVP